MIKLANYEPIDREAAAGQSAGEGSGHGRALTEWHRREHIVRVGQIPCDGEPCFLNLDEEVGHPFSRRVETEHPVPVGLRLHVRTTGWSGGRLITLTVVNAAVPDPDDGRRGMEKATLFQVSMTVVPDDGTSIVARPSRRAAIDDEDRSAALLYRNAREYAAGHTCSVCWELDEGSDPVRSIGTSWIPTALVPAVSSSGHEVFETLRDPEGSVLSAEWLAHAPDDELAKGLGSLAGAYGKWIHLQADIISDLDPKFSEQAVKNLQDCRNVLDRIKRGAERIGQDPPTAAAFRLANQAMMVQFDWGQTGKDRQKLVWRPFQLGFILLVVESLSEGEHPARSIMDLLWFPTGGGKTEAYLALVAFLAFYRRITDDDHREMKSVSSVMRYTLRLLTTQQFSRAAAMILACEAIRRRKIAVHDDGLNLGGAPFSIGLWVGGDATPNRFRDAADSLGGNLDIPTPIQIIRCPACGGTLDWRAVQATETVQVSCPAKSCHLFSEDAPLPIWTVDSDIYAEKPTLLIGTVDKFAQIVRRKEINSLFGVGVGLPPDLVIQDELHLISGPLGTVTGLYETAIDRLFSNGKQRPKIIGSTATIRRASDQVLALFNRSVCQFPPSGIDASDSGFAVVDKDAPGRLYAAVTTAGRSAKFTLQATAATLLQSAEGEFDEDSRRDPYWTLVSYFNSLRELGGALVLMRDDVNDAIEIYAKRRDEFAREPQIVEELTSRRSQSEVRDMLDLMDIPCGEDGAVDVVLASNMLSVGVDIPRLGLMLVNGQPKGIAEYIQATSRVGRGNIPGLVLSVLNNAKARDRSHFETFPTWHETIYRDVEATSVTPFASRSRDRALHAVLVTLIRHLIPTMLDRPDLDNADEAEVAEIVDEIVSRAAGIDVSENDVAKELMRRISSWRARAPTSYWNDKKVSTSLLQSAERAATMRALGRSAGSAWATPNSMRNVEPSVPFRLVEVLKVNDDVAAGPGDADGE
jgi:hypothetical protein